MVQVDNISLEIKNEIILNEVSLSAEKGEIIGIIGRNGSGKSMLFKAMVGFFMPQKGAIYIDGTDIITSGKFPTNMGALIESPGFLPSYTGYKNLELLASIQRKIGKEEINQVLKEVGLENAIHKKVRAYSVGMKQRLGIAQAYMESPEVIILDEPTNGLDKQGVAVVRALLQKLAEKGKTIFIASHISEDIEALSSKVYEMDDGALIPV